MAAPEVRPADRPAVCVLSGSPRQGGSCDALAAAFAEGLEAAGCTAVGVGVSRNPVRGCLGCGACSATGSCVLADRVTAARDARLPQRDVGFRTLYNAANGAQALVLVAPAYFSGPPSQLKAFLDRLQPLWARRYMLGARPVLPLGERRELLLASVGAGGDPFGREALSSCCRSALRMLDFELYREEAFVGESRDGAASLVRARELGGELGRKVAARYHSGNIYPVRDEDLGRAVFEACQ